MFRGVAAEIYYPANNPTWNEAAILELQAASENIVCIPYENQ